MPIYEYRCTACSRKVTLLVGLSEDEALLTCTHCGAARLTKLVSRFRRGRTEDDRVDEMADRLENIGEPESPSDMREMVKEMGRAMDDDYSDDMEELFETDMENPGLED